MAVLQEVASHGAVALALQRELALIGLDHFWFSGRDEVSGKRYGDKPYGNVIASRWPLQPRTWPVESEWPQLIISAEIGQSTGVRVVGVHIPNGSGNGWEKVFALEALAEGLQQDRLPTVLAGDFNEPKLFHPEFLSFGVDRRGRIVGDFTDLHGVTHPRQRWQAAVEAVLSPTHNAWGGKHAPTQIGVEFEPTHIHRRQPIGVLASPMKVTRRLPRLRTGEPGLGGRGRLRIARGGTRSRPGPSPRRAGRLPALRRVDPAVRGQPPGKRG